MVYLLLTSLLQLYRQHFLTLNHCCMLNNTVSVGRCTDLLHIALCLSVRLSILLWFVTPEQKAKKTSYLTEIFSVEHVKLEMHY